jgi:hypothetical protein
MELLRCASSPLRARLAESLQGRNSMGRSTFSDQEQACVKTFESKLEVSKPSGRVMLCTFNAEVMEEGSQNGFSRLFAKTIAAGGIARRDAILQCRRGVCFATGWSRRARSRSKGVDDAQRGRTRTRSDGRASRRTYGWGVVTDGGSISSGDRCNEVDNRKLRCMQPLKAVRGAGLYDQRN